MSVFYFLSSFLKNSSKFSNKCPIRQFNGKSLIGDKYTPLTENTLLGRMILYLNNNTDKNNIDLLLKDDNTTIDDLIQGKTSGLRNLTIDQVSNIFYKASNSALSYNKQHLQKLLNILDVECCLRLNTMEEKNVLKILSAFMYVVPNRITDYKFYEYAINNIDKYLESISKSDLLKFIFYIGLQKKNKKTQIAFKKCLRSITKELLEDLSIEDICIICNSTYRTNTKINNTWFLDKIRQTLYNNLILLKDPTLLVTLLKTLKQNNYQDEDLLSTISCTIFFNNTAQYYTFPVMCYILSLYAAHYYYDEELLNLFSDKCIDMLKETNIKTRNVHVTEQLRAKDISTFLWTLATLGYMKIDPKVLEDAAVTRIKQFINVGAYRNIPEELVNSVLYLWCLNCRDRELISLALSKENLKSLEEWQMKQKNNFNLLLKIMECEDPNLFADLNIQSLAIPPFRMDNQLKMRSTLQKIFQTLNGLCTDLEIEKFEMQVQIPHLNIIGITGFKEKLNKAVNIEVLDDYTCVKNKDCQPTGYMRLKLRILEQSDVPLLMIPCKEVEAMSNLELKTFLEDEIKLIV